MGEIRVTCKTADFLPYDQIEPLQGRLKKRTDAQLDKICRSIIKHGWAFPEFIWQHEGHNYCLDGHGRQEAIPRLIAMGYTIPLIPVVYIEARNMAEAKELLLKCISQYGTVTKEGFIEFADFDFDFIDFEIPDISFDDIFPDPERRKSLAERFIVPPLSVLRVASGPWQNRKKAWLSLGIQSDKGRDDGMLKSMAALAKKASGSNLPSESIFDPVLCEVMYRWFCPAGGQILDPFAGGSVRGIIAGFLDYNYTGIDLRQEQVDANLEQIDIVKERKQPVWLCGDSRNMGNLLPSEYSCDLVFSCPPYADLEVYSKLPEDLSNMDYSDFKIAYWDIIAKSCSYLNDDSFAVFVVGEARSKTGAYYGFVPDTVKAFEDAGVRFYNEIILVTQIAAKALTAAEGFVKSRKIGKIHQNVLVFVKGDPVRAAQKCKIDPKELEDAIASMEKAEAEEISA